MTQRPSSRRRVLRAAGLAVGSVLTAGCTSDGEGVTDTGPDSGGSTPKTTGTGSERPASGTPTASAADGHTASSPSPTGEPTPTPTATGPRTVTFPSADGTETTGTLYGTGDCGVVLVPQINRDRGSWEAQATALAERGHAALAIDENPDARAGSVLGAAQYLQSEVDADALVLVGASTGGEAVVRATARAGDDSVDGLVTLSAAGGESVASDLQGRSLFVASSGDDQRFVETARALHEGAPEPTALKLYEGSAHGQGLFASSHAEDLRSRLYGLLDEVCDEQA